MTHEEKTILIVEDDRGLARLISKRLEEAGFDLMVAGSGSEALEKATTGAGRVLLLDYKLGDMTGKQVVRKLEERGCLAPFIIMTASGDERVAVEMMKLGARDYIIKEAGFIDLLPQVVQRAIEQLETEKKLAETEIKLHQSQRRLRIVLDNSPSVIYQVDVKRGTFDYISPASRILFGYAPEQLMSLDIEKVSLLVHPDDRDRMKGPLLEMSDGVLDEGLSETIEYRWNHRNRGYRWMSDTRAVVYDDDGSAVAVVGNVTDVTERKLAEEKLRAQHEEIQVHTYQLEATNDELRETQGRLLEVNERLRESEERYRDLFDYASDLIQSVDADGRFVYVNSAWLDTLGYTREEVERLTFNDILSGDEVERWSELVEEIKRGREYSNLEITFRTKEGREVHVEGNVGARIKEGRFVATRGIFRDITERKRAEDKSREFDRMKSEFISSISHDLRTPLHTIKGFNRLMLSGMVSDPQAQREFYETIDRETNDLESLIDDLLDVSRLESGRFAIQKREVAMKDVVSEVIERMRGMAGPKDISLKAKGFSSLPVMYADRDRIGRVLMNLLNNAIKFSEQGSSISVMGEADGECLVTRVTDHGIGIPRDALAHVFDRFFQVDRPEQTALGGNGLGLYISKQIIDAHGGRIWIESEIGKGTTVNFTLPLNETVEKPETRPWERDS